MSLIHLSIVIEKCPINVQDILLKYQYVMITFIYWRGADVPRVLLTCSEIYHRRNVPLVVPVICGTQADLFFYNIFPGLKLTANPPLVICGLNLFGFSKTHENLTDPSKVVFLTIKIYKRLKYRFRFITIVYIPVCVNKICLV